MNKAKKSTAKKVEAETPTLSWHELQEVLRGCSTEDEVLSLIEEEKAGPNRMRWLLRMQGRFRTLRTERENQELMASQTKSKSKAKKR